MIEKYVDGPNVIKSKPVFSTKRFDVFLLRAPGKYVGDTHTDILDVYIAYDCTGDEHEELCPSPVCTVYLEHAQYKGGGVLNRIYRCSVLPPLGGVSFHPANVEPLINRKPKDFSDSIAAEVLFGIQEFAGPVTLVCMDTKGLDHCREFVEELLYEELNDQLLLAAVAAGF
jgi:hypothetical protein